MSDSWDNIACNNIDHYTGLLDTSDFSYKSLGWGSQESQYIRFKYLLNIDDLMGKSILDVGCGLGDMYLYLQEHNISVDYTGLDITPKMLEKARSRFPGVKFIANDLLNNPIDKEYDYLLASGIFTYINNDISFMKHMIRSMFSCCKKGLAFNLLSTFSIDRDPLEFQGEPTEVLAFAFTLTKKVKIDHSYLPHDFTVYMYH